MRQAPITSPPRQSSAGGFTLIELLVVIAIIGLLSSIVLASLNVARAKARDAERLSDMHQLQSALEMYANDHNSSYPSTGGSWWGNCSGYGSHSTSGANGWIPNLAPTYIAKLPLDPNPQLPSYCYLYRSDGKDYMLLVYMTVESYSQAANQWLRPGSPAQKDFAFYTSGASRW
ncbi:MAG: hypothetical protein B7W98_00555 [Parcubacteria group bacterium 20-58-5]|nr:MAG: hypothetical protein B7W98_00555 [Parcubacteria group bacterium 20-58-5]OYV63494.1 MAG: hypothetical protein B7X03_01610 [Parcubacteria group bacterium 21-58-10]OYV83138.1 MAG: hypothetical protein B7W96_00575 [Parcubacteria group bacterium 37-58-5]HQT82676.1 type II secretion system protein [Candidatus Paceibacterota bacterium]